MADVALAMKLRAELPGILNWAIDGCNRLRHDIAPATVIKTRRKYIL